MTRGLPEQVRDIESVSRMVYSVMLDTVAELESRNIAVTAGFRKTKELLAGMLNLSPAEAGTRVTYATQLAPRSALTGEVLAPLLPNTAAALVAGQIGPAQVRALSPRRDCLPRRSSGVGQCLRDGMRHVPWQGASASPSASSPDQKGNSRIPGVGE
ncbi:MAG: DUF222 domain-containing protein [Pseudonocardiaceae bacterium]